MGRPRRDRAVLARGDGREVPPRRLVRGARSARASRTPRAAASAAAPRSTAASTTGCPPSSPRSGSATTASTSSAPRRSTATRSASRPSSASPGFPARRPRRRPCSNGARPSSAGAPSSSPGSSATRRNGRAVKQTMARTLLPAAIEAGAAIVADCRVVEARARRAGASSAPRASRRCPTARPTPLFDPRRPRLRLRGRDPDARAAAAQRHPPQHRRGPEDAPDGEDRGALRLADRPRRRADAPGHRVRARPHDRRVGEPPRPRRARARRLRRRLRRRARATGRTSPSTTPRSAARVRAGCSRCRGCARRSSRTT